MPDTNSGCMLTAPQARAASMAAASPADRMHPAAILAPGRPVAAPPAIRAAHWPAAWAGLDALEATGLMATGVAKGRASRRPPACGATTSSIRRGRESNADPPHRYPHLAKDGELALASFNKQWRAFHDVGDEVLSEGSQQ